MVAVGASWPRDRKCVETPQFQGSRLCQRCKGAPETMLHRGWTCPANVGNEAHSRSDEMLAQASAQSEMDSGFWLRGMLPQSWTDVPPPAALKDWSVAGANE
eukprot:7483752-Pyramimonas_sp.AAC.1